MPSQHALGCVLMCTHTYLLDLAMYYAVVISGILNGFQTALYSWEQFFNELTLMTLHRIRHSEEHIVVYSEWAIYTNSQQRCLLFQIRNFYVPLPRRPKKSCRMMLEMKKVQCVWTVVVFVEPSSVLHTILVVTNWFEVWKTKRQPNSPVHKGDQVRVRVCTYLYIFDHTLSLAARTWLGYMYWLVPCLQSEVKSVARHHCV